MKQKYQHRLEHNFGLDTDGLLRDELNKYSERMLEMAERYHLPKNYICRIITYHTFRKVRRGREADLEKSVQTIERWLKRKSNRDKYWESLI